MRCGKVEGLKLNKDLEYWYSHQGPAGEKKKKMRKDKERQGKAGQGKEKARQGKERIFFIKIKFTLKL